MKRKTARREGGRTYQILWDFDGREYTLRVKGHSDITTQSSDFQEALDEIGDLIGASLGDFEAAFDYVPPAAPANPAGITGWLMSFGCNVSAEVINGDQLTTGQCTACMRPIGRAIGNCITVKRFPVSDVVGISHGALTTTAYSERLLEALFGKIPAALKVLQVNSIKPSACRYYEIIGGEALDTVAIKGIPFSEGVRPAFQCGKCGCREFSLDISWQGISGREAVWAGENPSKIVCVRSTMKGYVLAINANDYADFRDRHNNLKGIANGSGFALCAPAHALKNPDLPVIQTRKDLENLIEQSLKARRQKV